MSALPKPRRSRFSWVVTLAIVGAWLFLVGTLVKDRYFPDASQLAESYEIAAVESDDWFLVRLRGVYSGFGRSRQIKKDDHWLLLDELNISLNIQGRIKPIRIRNEAKVDDSFRLISFELKVASGIVSFEHKGRMEGREIVFTIPDQLGGGTRRIKVAERPRISRSLGLPVPVKGLEVGDEIRMPIFDPTDGQKSNAVIKVEEKASLMISGEELEAWLVRAIYRTMELNMWIDDQGKLLKGRMPLGITVVRANREEITREMAGVKDLPEMMTLSAVPVSGVLRNPRELTRLQLEILGGKKVRIASDTFRQERKEEILTINKEELPEATYAIPYPGEDQERHLKSSRFIRSDHPRIVEKAKEIVGNERDPVKAAQLINHWVYKHLKKTPTASIPDAYTVLETAQGDCNEHAVLAAALARAVGLPCKIALGLVFLDDSFYYHAWNAYWTGDTWITADALMDQMPTDPTHVTLLYGDVDKHMNVLEYLGKLSFRVVEAK